MSYKLLVGISPNLQLYCCWGQMNCLDFEMKRSKVKVTARPNMVT